MSSAPRQSRSPADFAGTSDHARDWSRPGPDDRGSIDDEGFRQFSDVPRRFDGTRRRTGAYPDYGADEWRWYAGVPEEYPPSANPASWPHWTSSAGAVAKGMGSPPPYRRGTPEEFGFAVPTYPHAGVASPERRGRFYGRGPKGYRRSDERIREEISDRLMTHPDIDASDIEVQVKNGVATLTGTVEDRHEKRLAEYITEDAVGVDDVENQLKVRRGFWARVSGEHASAKEATARPGRESGVDRGR